MFAWIQLRQRRIQRKATRSAIPKMSAATGTQRWASVRTAL